VVVDADVLYGGTTRGLLAYLDHQGLIRMHWSPLLIDEMSRALVKTGRRTIVEAHLNEALMTQAVPGASVPTVEVLSSFEVAYRGVNDAKDLHVAACAVALLACGYYPSTHKVHLITRNAKDFAPRKLAALDVVQQHPDAFLLELWQHQPTEMADAFRRFRCDLPSAPTVAQLIEKLAKDGQRRTAGSMMTAHAAGAHSF
jgi:hypothetical protein